MAGTGDRRGREEVRGQEGEQSPVTGKKYTGRQEAGPGRQSNWETRFGRRGGERSQEERDRVRLPGRPGAEGRRGDRSWDLSSFPDF